MKKVKFLGLILISVMIMTIVSCSKDTGKIAVTVEDNNGVVVLNAEVRLRDDLSQSLLQTLKTDDKGEVKFQDVLQGTYYVCGDDGDYYDCSNVFQLVSGETKEIKLHLDD